MTDETILSGTANRPLAEAIATELGVALGRATVGRYPDGEVEVRLDEPVDGRTIIVVQPTSPPVDANLVELLALADACRRGGAAWITAVVPYFGYARSDTRGGRRTPIMANLAAGMLEAAGIGRVVVVDPHAPQLEAVFRIPLDAVTAVPPLADAVAARLGPDAVVVSPDLGRVETAAEYGTRLRLPVAAIEKLRRTGRSVEAMRVIGEVRGRRCLIIDDMISTGGTIAECARALLEAGARPGFIVAATHGVLVAGAREALDAAEIRELWITDTIARPTEEWRELHVVPIAPLIAAALRRDGSPPAGPHASREDAP